jgi:hypothetical protein
VWYDPFITERMVAPCVSACIKEGVEEVFFTLWGDDGAYCEFDSAFAGIAFAAARALGEDDQSLRARHEAVCGIAYDEVMLASQLDMLPSTRIPAPPLVQIDHSWVQRLLWDDPVMGLYWPRVKSRHPDFWEQALRHYRRLARKLSRCRAKTEPVDMAHAWRLARYLAAKIELRLALDEAYPSRDRAKLVALAARATRMARMTEQLLESFRRQWLRRNRSQGFEHMETRLGGLRQRYVSLALALRGLVSGASQSIPELDEISSGPA